MIACHYRAWLDHGHPTDLEGELAALLPRLHAQARKVLGNDTDADDAVQEACVVMLETREHLPTSVPLAAIAHRLTSQWALMPARARPRRWRRFCSTQPSTPGPHMPSSIAALCSILLLLAVCLGNGTAGEAGPMAAPVSTWTDWSATAKSPAYAKARADAPIYDDQVLWPLLERNEAYYKESWAKARLLVWAKPGENGDWASAASWLEDGKPASAAPDQETDVLFPAAERKYLISNPIGNINCRHITLEKGASLMGGDGRGLFVWGNCWIKIGATLGIGITVPRGVRQTFNRNDHVLTRSPIGHPTGGEGNVDGHYIAVDKEKDGSVEYLGVHHALDKLYLKSGTTIVGPDSCLMSGGWNRPVVDPNATLVLMSGAYTGQRLFNDGRFCQDSLLVDGVLLAGTKERPLIRDAVISLNFKDTQTYTKATGLHVGPGGKLAMTSKDPKTARLVLRWSGVEEGPIDRQSKTIYAGADVPRRICMRLLGSVDLDGVLFMDVDRGGIQLANLAQKDTWKNVTFGANCGAEPAGLYAVAKAISVAKKKAKPEAGDAAQPAAAGKALYASQVWEAARQLIWAKPGQDGDPALAGNWLENGKPAASGPDRLCDVLLPEAAKAYTVGDATTYHVSARHLTVGRNAGLRSHQAIVHGNIWVQQGGRLMLTGAGLMLEGCNHSFLRDDNPWTTGANGHLVPPPTGLQLADLMVRKGYIGEPCTVEVLGSVHVQGAWVFYDPTINNAMGRYGASQFIIGPGATFTFGNWGPRGSPGGHGDLVLLSGSTFQRNGNGFQGPDELRVDVSNHEWGACLHIQAGTPERPLSTDAVLGLSAVEDDKQMSMLLRPRGDAVTLKVFSADPAKARLVLRWHGQTSAGLTKRGGKPRLVLGLLGTYDLDGVLFDDIGAGGIRLSDLAAWKAWKHVAFGANCDGSGDALFSLETPPKGN